MAKFIFAWLLLLTVNVYAQKASPSYADSLILEIGDKAKVIFLAKDREDFQEIARYDLNTLYYNLWSQLLKGENASVTEFSTDEAKAYFNDDFSKADIQPKTKFWKRFHINLFLGFSAGGFTEHLFQSSTYQLNEPPGGIVEVFNTAEVNTKPKLSYGLSISTKFPLIKQGNKSFDVGTSFGLDILKFNQESFNSGGGFFYTGNGNPNEFQGLQMLVDSLNRQAPIGTFANSTAINLLYLQLMPSFTFMDKQGKPTWNIGVGLRGGIDLKNLWEDQEVVEPLVFSNDRLVISENRTFQYGFVSTVGYKFVNVFCNFIPEAHSIIEFNGLARPDRTGRLLRGIWFIGLRLGK